ncbi:MAG: zinc ribbon domain-containing protein [Bifidobacteriaceae bacterium]|jgi:hypothetical protein|nr:zinc ribbon domain-containing protein [Bifidobacteriaceae bacterium]
MLEILGVWLLSLFNSKAAVARGRRGGAAIGYTIGLWLGMEILGGVIGAIVYGPTGDSGILGAYLFAISFALIGGAASWIIARTLPAKAPAQWLGAPQEYAGVGAAPAPVPADGSAPMTGPPPMPPAGPPPYQGPPPAYNPSAPPAPPAPAAHPGAAPPYTPSGSSTPPPPPPPPPPSAQTVTGAARPPEPPVPEFPPLTPSAASPAPTRDAATRRTGSAASSTAVAPAPVEPSAGPEPAPQARFCNGCGAPLKPGAKFCSKCGKQFA